MTCAQVSGIRFTFDPSQPPGSRVLKDSVTTGSERAPLDPAKTYSLATKQYMAEGKDGYDVLQVGCTGGAYNQLILTLFHRSPGFYLVTSSMVCGP